MRESLAGVAQAPTALDVALQRRSPFRLQEKIAVAYFAYAAMLAFVHRAPTARIMFAAAIPLLIWAAAALESRFSRPWSRVTRDWALLGLILIAYWEVDWISAGPAMTHFENACIRWDRILLDRIGLRAAIESLGSAIPSLLEAVYLSLYAIPALAMAALYTSPNRLRFDRFLTTLLFGTFCAYALLPLFPTVSPRIAFPGLDLPHYSGLFRTINTWLLDHCDISASVFPSGHVAVAFSAAFGLLRALPEKRLFWFAAFFAAAVVFIATIYCRYHYAADGAASLLISAFAWRLTGALERHE